MKRTGQRRVAGRAGGGWRRRGLLGAALLLALGCGSSTTGPQVSGLIIVSQQLVPDSSGCRLTVILTNRVGTDLSGQIGYKLLDSLQTPIGVATVFPAVPDGTTRSATSDLLKAGVDGHRLVCSEIASVQIDLTLTTVPIAPS